MRKSERERERIKEKEREVERRREREREVEKDRGRDREIERVSKVVKCLFVFDCHIRYEWRV